MTRFSLFTVFAAGVLTMGCGGSDSNSSVAVNQIGFVAGNDGYNGSSATMSNGAFGTVPGSSRSFTYTVGNRRLLVTITPSFQGPVANIANGDADVTYQEDSSGTGALWDAVSGTITMNNDALSLNNVRLLSAGGSANGSVTISGLLKPPM